MDLFPSHDPKKYRPIADDKEGIKELRPYWKYGFSTHFAVRFSETDPFGKLGWRYPVEYSDFYQENLPRKASEIGKIVGYMTKYMTKSQALTLNNGVKTWKTRTNKTFGKQSLMDIISKLPMKQLIALIIYRKYPRPMKVYGQEVPTKLIRAIARKELVQNRTNKQKQNYLHTLPKQELFKDLLRSTTLKTTTYNTQNFTTIMTKIMSNMDTCKNYYPYYVKAWQTIAKCLPIIPETTPVSCGNTKTLKKV
jgi:hypothetical protein